MSGYAAPWGHHEGEPWDEEVAIRLLKEAAAEVAMYEEDGTRMPDREHYHARIQEAHGARNMEAYREAVNGYATAAREAHRQKARRQSQGGGA
jgi:hypothetical protein